MTCTPRRMTSMAALLGMPPMARHVRISGIPVRRRCSEKNSSVSWICLANSLGSGDQFNKKMFGLIFG